MKPVVHLTPLYFGEEGTFGGGERYPAELARAMAHLVPTVLVAFGARRRTIHDGPLRIELLPVRHRWKGSEVNPLSEYLPQVLGRCGVLHLHQWETVVANIGVLHARVVGARVFATDHGGSGRNYAAKLRLHRLLHGFLPVSHYSASFYPKMRDRTTVIYGGVDVDRYAPTDAPRLERALFVGRLLPHKGILELIDALPPDLPLHVIGRPYAPAYRDLLRAHATGRAVTFDEDADDEAVRQAYRTSRVVVLPSLDPPIGPAPKTELLGLTLVEAMACGTPVVCTATGGMPEVVDGSGGVVVPQRDSAALGDAVIALTRPGPAWDATSRAARRHVVDSFTWRGTALRCLDAYRHPAADEAGRLALRGSGEHALRR